MLEAQSCHHVLLLQNLCQLCSLLAANPWFPSQIMGKNLQQPLRSAQLGAELSLKSPEQKDVWVWGKRSGVGGGQSGGRKDRLAPAALPPAAARCVTVPAPVAARR